MTYRYMPAGYFIDPGRSSERRIEEPWQLAVEAVMLYTREAPGWVLDTTVRT